MPRNADTCRLGLESKKKEYGGKEPGGFLTAIDDNMDYPVTRFARALLYFAICAMWSACSMQSAVGSQDTVHTSAQPRTIDDIPCPAMPVVSPERMRLIVEPEPHIVKTPPASEHDRAAYMNWVKIDPAGVCRYREENRALAHASRQRVVFVGDSITEAWREAVPSLFTDDVLDRGVSGQTTTQMLARFRTDVIDLHPAVVHIMGGINDIANSAGTVLTRSNIESMVELARMHGIVVILGAVTPSSLFQNSPGMAPGPQIVWLNDWLRDYAEKQGLIYVDYHAPLRNGGLGIKGGLSNDGLHPNRRGFEVMSPLARTAIHRALKKHEAFANPGD
jgi:lysophospholipase L1-like esterase